METYTVTVDNEKNVRFYKPGTSVLHRLDGPAVVYADKHKSWYIGGKLHRLDGPAVESANGYKAWYVEGKRHRTDGPAIEDADGRKEWWVEGISYTEEQFKKKTCSTPSCDGKVVEIDGKKYKLTSI